MSIITALSHITHYKYSKPTSLGMQTIRLRPAPHTKSNIKSYSLKVAPEEHFINWQQDPFGNFLARIVFTKKVLEFRIEVDLISENKTHNPFDFFLEESVEKYPFKYDEELKEDLRAYLEIKDNGPLLNNWLKNLNPEKENIIDFIIEINQKLNSILKYNIRLEAGFQSCEETLRLGSGSCRDMAWFLCQAFRHLGIASRFASGYLIQLKQDVKSIEGPSGVDEDCTDLHAWTEVYLPGAGWVGLDPTSGLFTSEGHIPLCCTPNPSGAAPISGTLEEGTNSELNHEMKVERIKEDIRVTKPYSKSVWNKIDNFGQKIDRDLKKQDVRLTMGGEPTFISIDDKEGDEWNFKALGGNKKLLAKNILAKLFKRFAYGGFYMFTQGKWYPNEVLPRWAMPCFWREDNEIIWKNTNLLADPDKSLKHNLKTSQDFIRLLGERLGISSSYAIEMREDTPYYLFKERKLPLQNEVMEANVFDKLERERLQVLIEKDLNKPIGYALPLHYSLRKKQWISNNWKFKSPQMILLTGDSPAGLRLPLSSLPSPDEMKEEFYPKKSTFSKNKRLPTYNNLKENALKALMIDDKNFKKDTNGLIHTAICGEVRNGILHIFIPPITLLEKFLELICIIESVAEDLKIPVILEGYTPPLDSRIGHFSVTPDPGVIEINVQPSANWEELKNVINSTYEEARVCRLGAEKFMLDGKRVGTGGGNHIVLGAKKPEDSPFLRRPDLLRSMVSFWQNHPSLSYLFCGMYIGPDSQAPRIDEARHDSLYELELAFSQIPQNGEVEPWLVDRLFRNLFADVTGNTHRTEFCIDKLYSPDSDRGRLGLLEMRGFEMTPHPQMNLLQNLLLRTFIAYFWKKPYQEKLIRWGTNLSDKFMLPYYVEEDFQDVLQFLDNGGYKLDLEWFKPFFAFRFPECGHIQIGDKTLLLHTALEPWPAMGEEPAGGGVSRSIDTTLERLQITAKGLVEGRHIVTCNKRFVPLSRTSNKETQIAGIRFKAWAQDSSLHPKLPVNAPLVFDVIDTQLERSIGGFTYHVSHPGGRSYKKFPINENVAEGRVISRFDSTRHTSNKIYIPSEEINREFPHNLDLRRKPPL
jgi:uncharacterized protein (DUF2126 family)